MNLIAVLILIVAPLAITARLTHRRTVNIVPPLRHERLAEWERRRGIHNASERMREACALAELDARLN